MAKAHGKNAFLFVIVCVAMDMLAFGLFIPVMPEYLVMINPVIETSGEVIEWREGCLSIPGFYDYVNRYERIKMTALDINGNEQSFETDGMQSIVFQHEYDHIEGVLFTDHLNPFKRRLLKRKLDDISKGKVDVDYKMKFPKLKR